MGRAIMIGLLAVLAGFGSWYNFRAASRVASTPVQSARALADARPGVPVALYGRVQAQGAGLVLATTSEERCETRWERDADGRQRSRRVCRDVTIARQTPPFALVLNDGDQPTVRVINSSYQLEGRMHTVDQGRTKQQGFQNGDSVLVIGATAAAGTMQAETVYGGTRDQYVGNSRLLAWGLALLAVVLLAASIILVWFY